MVVQLIRDDLRASTGGGGDGGDWWRGGEEGRGGKKGGEEEQEEAQMDSLEDYVELLYEGKDKVRKGRCRKLCLCFNSAALELMIKCGCEGLPYLIVSTSSSCTKESTR